MTSIDLNLVGEVVLLLLIAAFTTVVGIYLLMTNPPKDETAFVGFGTEKVSNGAVGRD